MRVGWGAAQQVHQRALALCMHGTRAHPSAISLLAAHPAGQGRPGAPAAVEHRR